MKDTKEPRIKIFVCAILGQGENFMNFGRMEERSGQLNESYEDCLGKEHSGATDFAVDGGNLPVRSDVDDELMLEVSHEVIVISDDSDDEMLVEATTEVIDIADDSDDEPVLQVTQEVTEISDDSDDDPILEVTPEIIEISDDSDDDPILEVKPEVIEISDDSDDDPILEVTPEIIEISDDSGEEVQADQVPAHAISEDAGGWSGSLFSDQHIKYAVTPDHTYSKVVSNNSMEIVSDDPKEDLSIQHVDSSGKTYGEIRPYDLDLDDCLFDGIAEIVPCPSLDEIVLDESSLETNLSLDQLMELYLGAE
ncbi:unnamed protein product [Orchesella dallaii]|uniref:Uncharacterized protein n=1 Tax=Orchesella dallaii TaxID=48710 RepID=A0ABP1QPD1_9HEXA